MKSIELMKEYFATPEFEAQLKDVYIDTSRIAYQKERYSKALDSFSSIFGEEEIEIYSAPGRTEVGGNHTDHQQGEVLAASINNDAIAVVSKREDNVIRIKSEGYDMITLTIPAKDAIAPNEKEFNTTPGLIRGVAAGFYDRDYAVGGFDAYVTSDVLSGSGLSSSAAFETIIGTILSGLYNDMKVDAVTIAIIGQFAENVYFGKPCGLMDQMACSVGSLCHIDFKDPAHPVVEKVTFDMDAAGYSLCITDTKGSHADLTPDYAAIPKEMKEIASFFGKNVLIETSEEEVIKNIPELNEKFGGRAVVRALHFFRETRHAAAEAKALKDGNVDEFLKVVAESGQSSFQYLQNVYPSSQPARQNVSIALAVSDLVLGEGHEYGIARVHGGGFAGTIQAFVKNEKVAEYKAALDAIFGEGACDVLKIRKYGGIKIV